MLRMASILPAVLCAGVLVEATIADAAPVFRRGVYDENISVTCSAGATCTAKFSAMPEEILFARVSCSILTGAPNVTRVLLGQLVGSTLLRSQFLVPNLVVTVAGKSQYIVSTGVNLQLDTGEIPAIRVVSGAFTSLSLACQIVGETVAI